MSIQLVIAEKPSVARSIAGVTGADKKQDGYFEAVSYTHLDVYKRQATKWTATFHCPYQKRGDILWLM